MSRSSSWVVKWLMSEDETRSTGRQSMQLRGEKLFDGRRAALSFALGVEMRPYRASIELYMPGGYAVDFNIILQMHETV